jgi:hypothetical protein
MCSKTDNHSKFNGQLYWEDVYDYMTYYEHKNVHFDIEKDIKLSSKNYEESGYNLNLDHLVLVARFIS